MEYEVFDNEGLVATFKFKTHAIMFVDDLRHSGLYTKVAIKEVNSDKN